MVDSKKGRKERSLLHQQSLFKSNINHGYYIILDSKLPPLFYCGKPDCRNYTITFEDSKQLIRIVSLKSIYE